uniref:Glutamyl-Q tRNA(Asp) synthetase n=1 Tax=uncultured Thiotrichaceae bacterium TaxID=298394 RepID=A0A6S6SZ37_9GAMM|nr:MAG: glutamyl-Q-tRNA synthetase [uncultured Thiotrichaceae bacterium]
MYIGRFAPTPSGPLHFGSLLAAMASYLEARSQQGKWLLRIEDIDKPREVSGAANQIIHAMEHYGFQWDGKIEYQSTRTEAYQYALNELSPHTYPCTCSRRKIRTDARLGTLGLIYPGNCRKTKQTPENQQYAIRIRTPDKSLCIHDAIQGQFCQNLAIESGDFIIRRADKLFAYQLAVVVDDQWQGITHIVRGADLLDNTQRQIHLQQCLNYTTPDYMHIPLASYPDGQKLSKHTHAPALITDDTKAILSNLCRALSFLGQKAPNHTEFDHLQDCWDWAIQHWDNTLIPKKMSIPLSDTSIKN